MIKEKNKEEITKCEETINDIIQMISKKEETLKNIETVISLYENDENILDEKIKNLKQVITNESLKWKYGFLFLAIITMISSLVLLEKNIIFSIIVFLISCGSLSEHIEIRKKMKQENKENKDYETYVKLSQKERKEKLQSMKFELHSIIKNKIEPLRIEKQFLKKENDKLISQLIEEKTKLRDMNDSYIYSLLGEWDRRKKDKKKTIKN